MQRHHKILKRSGGLVWLALATFSASRALGQHQSVVPATNLSSINDLKAFLAGDGASLGSATEAFDALFTRFPKALAGAATVYQSGSLQHASPASPRLIAFAPDGTAQDAASSNLVLTVAPLEGATGRLEALSFDQTTGLFSFAEVTFPSNADGIRAPRVEDNPARCGACHGIPGRPIWDTYHLWPGVYAGVNEIVRADTAELANFEAFLATAKTADVYKDYPFATSAVPDLEGGVLRNALMPQARDNLQLGLTLSYAEFERVAFALTHGAFPREHKFALLAAAGRCDLVMTGLPASLYPAAYLQALTFTPAQVGDALKAHLAATQHVKQLNYFQYYGAVPPSTIDIEVLNFDLDPVSADLDGALNFVMQAAGASGAAWSMENRPHSYAFEEGYSGMLNLAWHIARAAPSDPDLAAFFLKYPAENARGFSAAACNALKDMSTAALAAVPTPRLLARAAAADPLQADVKDVSPLVRCASCHAQSATMALRAGPEAAPIIPFDDPAALAGVLKNDGIGLGNAIRDRIGRAVGDPLRMPPAPFPVLTVAERASLSDLVSYLATEY